MKLLYLKIFTNILATFVGVLFLLLNYFFQKHLALFLSMEVLLLPMIYIISNIFTESLLEQRTTHWLTSVLKDTDLIFRKNNDLLRENERLKYQLSLIKNRGKK